MSTVLDDPSLYIKQHHAKLIRVTDTYVDNSLNAENDVFETNKANFGKV